jgi:hypothetical protein
MTVRRLLSFCGVMMFVALLCFSVTISGTNMIGLAVAADVNTTAPASNTSGQISPYQISSSPSPAQTQSAAAADSLSQIPTIPLVPFQLTVANETVLQPTQSNASATVGASQAAESSNVVPSADAASGAAAHTAEVVSTNVTQPAADNGSLAPIPPVSGGGGGNGLILVISLSYGTAIVVLAVMRYWSFSFDEGAESPPKFDDASVAYRRGSAYSTLESVENGLTVEGQSN